VNSHFRGAASGSRTPDLRITSRTVGRSGQFATTVSAGDVDTGAGYERDRIPVNETRTETTALDDHPQPRAATDLRTDTSIVTSNLQVRCAGRWPGRPVCGAGCATNRSTPTCR
jgi:hypothetical protein